ncbi:Amino acid transporter transmembrane domain-containing protein [Caenorhabditis elegans]|uniref:Amino acid transporter transmembrane domain-containing protein n=1 Tax=Caenorhabditis elegans TaxID=6239 RepID=H2KY81_CAEEL|nr:Amino acid transporter transmembrane domain-containing protein [Caenorhabditis elegans]CCD61560.1 Amino acid transporter transmembrane domain-containing protein [Caenorhabditis elegans]|eukprot:NP_001022027.1 SLC (SoLute Carrier) homolog [Caenorhabditis elegans]
MTVLFPPSESSVDLEHYKKAISSKFALINLMKGMLGAGCFSVPLAFKQSGYVSGLVIIVVLGFLCALCMIKLVKCAGYLSKVNQSAPLDYGNMAYKATQASYTPIRKLAPVSRALVNSSLCILQLGICCCFYIFVVYHLHELLEFVMNDVPSRATLFPMVLPAFILLVSLSSMRALSLVSLGGNFLMLIALAVIMFQLLTTEHKKLADLPPVTDLMGIVSAAGTILYALEGQAMVLPLENRMKKPEDMKGPFGVLSVGVGMVVVIYSFAGFFGFLTYGNDVQDSITLNLPNDHLGIFVKAVLLFVVYSGFLIQVFPIVAMIWPAIKKKLRTTCGVSTTTKRIVHFAFRYSIVIVVFLLSYAIPRLSDMVPLVGVTAGMLLALVFPSLFHLLIFLPQFECRIGFLFDIFLDFVCIILGMFFVIYGSITHVQHLMH